MHVATEIARGLAHAHVQGVVHGDLKPGNVFLCEDGQVKVLDFGLAHVFGRGGLSGGTPAYMAPEQARGGPSDERGDVYALGVIVQELVSGSRPGPAAQPSPVLGRGTRGAQRAPAALSRLVQRMLEPDPAGRPASAVEVHAQLAAIRRSLEPRRLFWTAWAVAGIALVLAAVLGLRAHPLPAGRLLVAMADTANGTGDPDFDATGTFLGTALEQSRRVALMARSRLVNILGSREAGRDAIDERLARAAARQGGARILVLPAIRKAGDGYVVAVHAIELERDEPIFALRESAAAKGSVPDAIDRLSARLLGELGEKPSDSAGPRVKVADFVPANTEAWRHFAEWQRLRSEGRLEEARAAFDRALAADPEYPLAHVILLLTGVQGPEADVDEAFRHAEIARRNLHRIPPKERMLVEAITGVMYGGTQAERMRTLDRVIESWPEEPLAHLWAGNIMLHEYADPAAARPYLEKAVAIAPLSPQARIFFLVALGRLDDALAVARRLGETKPDAESFALLSAVHRWRGEPAEALAAARRSVALATTAPIGPLQRWAFVESDALEELEATLSPRGDRSPAGLALRGRWREALAEIRLPPPCPAI